VENGPNSTGSYFIVNIYILYNIYLFYVIIFFFLDKRKFVDNFFEDNHDNGMLITKFIVIAN